MRRGTPLIIGAALALAGSSAVAAPSATAKQPAAAAAKKPARAAQKPASKVDLTALKVALESGSESEVRQALARVRTEAEPQAAPLVEEFLQRGANAGLLLEALETVRVLALPSSASAVAPYVRHRNAEVRRAAVAALVATRSPVASVELRRALRSNDAELRRAAARGLGALGARDAVPDLFAVLPREVPEAAASLGELCVQEQCEQLVGLLGKIPFEILEQAVTPLLLRPEAEVPETLKLKLIERLRLMATTASLGLIQGALARFPETGSAKVKGALGAALKGHSVYP